MKNIKIIAFSGKMGTGKDFIAKNYILPALNRPTVLMAFADHFKVDVITKDNIDRERVFVTKDTISREKLQRRGTEEGRDKYGEDIWVRTLKEWILVFHKRNPELCFMITDLRFKNELEAVKEWGGTTIRVEAPSRNMYHLEQYYPDPIKRNKIQTHISETELDNELNKFDHILDNDFEVNKNTFIDNINKIITDINEN